MIHSSMASERPTHPDDGPLADRFRRHAEALIRDQRSPLSAALMRGAADNLDKSGSVEQLFAGIAVAPGSVPQLRLLAALHHLVLAGRAPALAAFYPSVGGGSAAQDAWPVAAETIQEHFSWIRARLERTVQTNEPGRSAALYPALLWLTSQFHHPIRLLELGASAGLNLIPDRYCYLTDGRALGDSSSAVSFEEPWQPGPEIDLDAAARELTIVARAGCDRSPLNPRDPEQRLTLLSYIWPDETGRIDRMRMALGTASQAAPEVASGQAGPWLRKALEARPPDVLTVIWHSVFRQYLVPEDWAMIKETIRLSINSDRHRPIAWVSLEPGRDGGVGASLRISATGRPPAVLADCDYHGPPVRWRRQAPGA
jgi:hypothetical protein